MVVGGTEKCRCILVYDKIYFISEHLLACYISVNICKCADMEHVKYNIACYEEHVRISLTVTKSDIYFL
jgi:hypothetical protein